MKKIIVLFILLFTFAAFDLTVSACPQCEDPSSVSYHYRTVCNGQPYLNYSASLMPENVSAPIYDIHVVCNGANYLLFLSSGPFSGRTGATWGQGDDATGSGSTSPFSDVRYKLFSLQSGPGAMFDYSFDGWYSYPGSFDPKNYIELTSVAESSILAIDTTNMIPCILADGSVNVPAPFDPYNNDYSDDIPAPEVYRDGDKIMFSNSSPDMLLLANIRWYSVDDITLFKESLSWKYRPDSIIHSDLNWLLSVDDHYSSVNGINLYELGEQSFQEFLSGYPIENRTYLGGTNAIGNYLFGYNDALSTLKMVLGQIDSSFNAPELFFRYYVPLADGTYKCGKWTKYSRSLPSGPSDGAIDGKWNVQYQVSDAPLTSDDVLGSKPNDTSGMTTYTSKDNTVVVDFDSPDYTISIDNLNQITSLFGQFPTFVSTVFCFLPSWILSLIGCTITLLVGLAVYHALRG